MKSFVLLIGVLGSGCFWNTNDDNAPPINDDAGVEPDTNSGEHGACGEPDCSPKTPDGLRFAAVAPINSGFPHGLFLDVHDHIANTGTTDIVLRLPDGSDFALPFDAQSSAPDLLSIEHVEGPRITVRASGGDARLRILDPETGQLFDRKQYHASSLANAVAVAADEWITAIDLGSAQQFVFAPGARRVGVAYLDAATDRLVDTSATITLAGATQSGWDTVDLTDAVVGHRAAAVHVGDADGTVDIEVVAAPDFIEPLLSYRTFACFGGFAHGAFVSGLAWTFTIDGHQVHADDLLGPNCVSHGTAGFTVTASAGGHSVTFTTAE